MVLNNSLKTNTASIPECAKAKIIKYAEIPRYAIGTMTLLDEGYSRNTSGALKQISTFLLLSLIR